MILGTTGVGKSRLAIELAQRLQVADSLNYIIVSLPATLSFFFFLVHFCCCLSGIFALRLVLLDIVPRLSSQCVCNVSQERLQMLVAEYNITIFLQRQGEIISADSMQVLLYPSDWYSYF